MARTTDLNQFLDQDRWTFRQKTVLALAALTVIFDGMDIRMMGFAIPAIAREWGIARASFAPVLSLGLLGMTMGNMAGGLAGDRLAGALRFCAAS